MRSRNWSRTFADFKGGKETVPLFTIYLILDETPVYMPEFKTARCFAVSTWSGVMQQAPELGRKTVSL